jgi:hypothetical protein
MMGRQRLDVHRLAIENPLTRRYLAHFNFKSDSLGLLHDLCAQSSAKDELFCAVVTRYYFAAACSVFGVKIE